MNGQGKDGLSQSRADGKVFVPAEPAECRLAMKRPWIVNSRFDAPAAERLLKLVARNTQYLRIDSDCEGIVCARAAASFLGDFDSWHAANAAGENPGISLPCAQGGRELPKLHDTESRTDVRGAEIKTQAFVEIAARFPVRTQETQFASRRRVGRRQHAALARRHVF